MLKNLFTNVLGSFQIRKDPMSDIGTLMILEVFICSLRWRFLLRDPPHWASAIENAAAVLNLDNITICFCRGRHCLRERGRYYCPYKRANNFCFSACHEWDFGQCMNNRRVHEDTHSGDTDHTVRSFWDRFIDLYIAMFLNFMEAGKGLTIACWQVYHVACIITKKL